MNFKCILTVYGQPFVEILPVGQDYSLPEVARALMVGVIRASLRRSYLYITHKGRLCVLAELVLLRSFWGVLSRLEGTRLTATLPLIVSTDSITSRGTHRLKNADILRSEMKWAGSKGRRNFPRELDLVDARNELKHAKHEPVHQKPERLDQQGGTPSTALCSFPSVWHNPRCCRA